MAKEIETMVLRYDGDPADAGVVTKATITYCVRDTADNSLKKNSEIIVTTDPTTVDWADARSRVKTAEGIA